MHGGNNTTQFSTANTEERCLSVKYTRAGGAAEGDEFARLISESETERTRLCVVGYWDRTHRVPPRHIISPLSSSLSLVPVRPNEREICHAEERFWESSQSAHCSKKRLLFYCRLSSVAAAAGGVVTDANQAAAANHDSRRKESTHAIAVGKEGGKKRLLGCVKGRKRYILAQCVHLNLVSTTKMHFPYCCRHCPSPRLSHRSVTVDHAIFAF